mmetsp:Transcript_147385/g.455941  ORF Transcript_147385/g.455941 Transcript_147385/m.455941 type:complete len:225 (-) Transcript_147385:298-972(-)
MSSSIMSLASSHMYVGTLLAKMSLATYASLPKGVAATTSRTPKAKTAGPLWGPAPGKPTVPAATASEKKARERAKKSRVKRIQAILARLSGTVCIAGWLISTMSAGTASDTMVTSRSISSASAGCSCPGSGGSTSTVTAHASPWPSDLRVSVACKNSPRSGPASLAQSARLPSCTTTLEPVSLCSSTVEASWRCTLINIRKAAARPTARLTLAFCSTAGASQST